MKLNKLSQQPEYYAASDAPLILFDTSIIPRFNIYEQNAEQIGTIKVGIPKDVRYPTRMAVLQATIFAKEKTADTPEVIKKIHQRTIEGLLFRLSEAPPADPKKSVCLVEAET